MKPNEFLIGAAILAAAGFILMQSDQSGTSLATIYQSGPAGSDATVEVKRWGDFTVIERRDHNGNSATVVQQNSN